MNLFHLSTISALFSALRHNIIGEKKLAIGLLSLFTVILSFYTMISWSSIETVNHVIFIDKPIASDSLENTIIELRIKSNEGYQLSKKGNSTFEEAIRINQKYNEKGKSILHNKISKRDSTIFSLFEGKKGFVSKNRYNCIFIAHHFDGNISENNIKIPENNYEKEFNSHGVPFYCYTSTNDEHIDTIPFIYYSPYSIRNAKLSYISISGKKNESSIFKETFYSQYLFSLYPCLDKIKNKNARNKYTDMEYINKYVFKNIKKSSFFTLHDISKKEYRFIIIANNVDEVNFTYESNSYIECSNNILSKAEKDGKSISLNFNKFNKTKFLVFIAKDLDSEDTQQIRMFIVMTLCSMSLGYLLTIISDKLWLLVKGEKTK